MINRVLNVLRCSHPFSSVMATCAGIIISSKLLDSNLEITYLACIFLLAQFITGIMNDYLDFHKDQTYQPSKPAVRLQIPRDDLKYGIIICLILLLLLSILVLPLLGVLLVTFGLLTAQSYNFGLKYSILSGFIFAGSFGLMLLIPVVYLMDGFPFSLVFLISGGSIGFILHLANANLDLNVDRQLGSHSLAVTLGESRINYLVIGLFVVIDLLNQYYPILLLSILFILVFSTSQRNDTHKIRELGYYSCTVFSLFLLYLIPIN